MTEQEFFEQNPCIYKTITSGNINKKDVLKQSEFFKTHSFAFKFLPENYAHVLMVRFGLFDGNIYNLKQVGDMFNVSKEWVRIIQDRSFKKLVEEPYLNILMKFNDETIQEELIDFVLTSKKSYKLVMLATVRKALAKGLVLIQDDIKIDDLKINRKESVVKNIKTILTENGILTLNELFSYLEKNKNLTNLEMSNPYYNEILYAIIRLIGENKISFKDKEIEFEYRSNRDKYLGRLKRDNLLDAQLFPEHEKAVLNQAEFLKQKQIDERQESIRLGLIKQTEQRERNVKLIEEKVGKKLDEVSINILNFSFRTYNALGRAGIHTLAQLIDLYMLDRLKDVYFIGQVSLNEIERKISSFSYTYKIDEYLMRPKNDNNLAIDLPSLSAQQSKLERKKLENTRREDIIKSVEEKFGTSLKNVGIEVLNLKLSTYNALRRAGIHNLNSLLIYYLDCKDFEEIRTIGHRASNEINDKIEELLSANHEKTITDI